MSVLVLNAGSSTLKCSLFAMTGLETGETVPVWQAHIDWDEPGGALLRINTGEQRTKTAVDAEDRPSVIASLICSLWGGENPVVKSPQDITTTGHRIVHGGIHYADPVIIDQTVKAAIHEHAPLAPDHQPHALMVLNIIMDLLPHAAHVAVFDTGFHRTLPDAASIYPIPHVWYERGIRRYGFHGISHQYAAERTAHLMNRPLADLKMITCHLGNGASLCAINGGKSVDTTMGFTPLEGLMMGSRCGSIDPGILPHLLRKHGMDLDELEHMLHRESGLLGISGVSSDMREILRLAAENHAPSRLALDAYIQQLRRQIGAMLASLGGMDVIVFTGGIGENSPQIRQAACAPFAYAGLMLDVEKNESGLLETDLRGERGQVGIYVLKADENLAIFDDIQKIFLSRQPSAVD